MKVRFSRSRLRTVCAVVAFSGVALLVATGFRAAQAAPDPNEQAFEQTVKPFFRQNCVGCHNADNPTAGIQIDQLDSTFSDRHIRVWDGIRHRLEEGTMPPKGMPQPTAEQRTTMVAWIAKGIETARLRPAPRNGLVRRLTVAQYRNTLRELLGLDDDLTTGIPPDAVSKDGFVNNQETLALSTSLIESYLEIADEGLKRAIVDPKQKPSVQDFRVELGASVNPNPYPEELILGAGSQLLANKDVLVTQPVPVKPFAFDPYKMRTKYRFIEGYAGNDTVRGWREYDSIYHAVFADMRGSGGYPKGVAYSTVPEGLLLRPAIPNDEQFGADGTYGPKANFKISVRELPDDGRFRITVFAAKYDDGLLLDKGSQAQPATAAGAIAVQNPGNEQTVTIPKAGVYQVDVYQAAPRTTPEAPDASHISEALAGSWNFDSELPGKVTGKVEQTESPFGRALAFSGEDASVAVAGAQSTNVGAGDFTVALWVNPEQFRQAGILGVGEAANTQGWALDLDNRGSFRMQASGAGNKPLGAIASGRGMVRPNTWQHVAVVVQRGKKNGARMYINGYPVAKGEIAADVLDHPKASLYLGKMPSGQPFKGKLDDVRIYRRALKTAELQALIAPGKEFAKMPQAGGFPGGGGGGRGQQQGPDVTLTLGGRQFIGTVQPAFLAVRLPAGPLKMDGQLSGTGDLEKVVFTPLAADSDVTKRFLAFEKRVPKVGVHLGFRRDCGSTFTQVGEPQVVGSEKLTKYVFEGAMRNFPNTEVEKDNVNYLAGVREIGVRSEYTDGRDMPRLLIRYVEFEGPYYDVWPPASHRGVFIESAHKNEPAAYAQDVVRNFATRAYRRPATEEEVKSLMGVYRMASESGKPFQESVKEALQVVLTSPQFLFLIEKSQSSAPEPLDNYELASKLSYFLWNGPPDRRTLQLAGTGALRKQLDLETARMMNDAKFSRFVREFTSQWLNLDKFSVLEPDRRQYPLLTSFTRTQLRDDPIHFVEHLIRNNLPVRNLIQSDFIVANETVANYYGLGDKTDSGFRFVPVQHGRTELGGVLTEAALMAGLSDGRESNPVKRGAWLARKIIAEPPADPPPNVPALKEDKAHTLRERLEQHRNNPGCLQCHSKIDPWGVALEEFDAGGRKKQQPVDAHSVLPDKTEVKGVNDLKKYLSEDRVDQVAFSVLKHLATYGTGRTLTYSELSFLKQDALKLKADGYRMKDMVRYVVNSSMFLEK